jgi:hypothetical protein
MQSSNILLITLYLVVVSLIMIIIMLGVGGISQ